VGKLDKIYSILPVWAQNCAATGYGIYWKWLRFGPGFAASLAGFQQRERFSASEWQTWQQEQLRLFLSEAADRVPFYRQLWTDEQKQAAREGRLNDLPILSKDSVRSDSSAFLNETIRPIVRPKTYTSGSTGTPVTNYWTPLEIRRTRALREVRSAGWAGVSFSMPRATFSGRMVVTDANSQGPFHRFNRMENQVYFSAFHLSPATAPQYVAALHQHKIEWLTGYAVSYYLLARHILDQKLEVPALKAVVTTSEKLTPEMRSIMEQAYRCRIFEEYSSVENAVFASECEAGRLHVSPDSGIVEIVRENGSPCAFGETGEVIATCLLREYQPLIRYRIGDLAAWDDQPCPCGRQMPILKEVVGRIEDVVVGPDGREMVRFHGIFANQPNIVEGQIIQEALDLIRVRVVPTSAFSPVDVADIESRIKQRLGSVQVIVEKVSEIPRSKAGKFKAVISLLSCGNK
jgi:phenylacetate-CoA ligase